MSVKLTISDRYNLMKYCNRLQSTMNLRMAIDQFFNQIEITEEETERFKVSINPKTYELSCNDDLYTKEFESFPKEVVLAIKEYVDVYTGKTEYESNKIIQNMLEVFRKVI